MRKSIKVLFFALMATVLLAVSASAGVTVTYDVTPNQTFDGVYNITATLEDTKQFDDSGSIVVGGFRGFRNIIEFKSDVFTPVNSQTGEEIANIAGSKNKKSLTIVEVAEDEKASYTSTSPVWTENDGVCTLDLELYTQTYCDASNLQVFTMTVKLSDEYQITNIPAESFSVNYIAYGNEDYNYYGSETETNNITVVNNIKPKSKIKLSVDAGSTVHHQDGTQQYVENAGEVDVVAVDGVVIVNKGFTSQKFYKIDANAQTATIVPSLEDALLTSENVGIRSTGNQGIRFKSSVHSPALALDEYEIVRYGHIATAESTKTELVEGEYTLDMALVEAGLAIKGETYNTEENKNIVFDFDEVNQRTIFAGVMINIPESEYETPIIYRAYYELSDGTIVYSPTNRVTVYQIAKAIKEAGGDAYENNKDYIDSIVDPIDQKHEQEELAKTTVWVDIQDLFKN